MSLYSGIKFAVGDAPTQGESSSNASSQLPSGSQAGPSSAKGTSTTAGSKADPGWSAALKFAPRLNKPKPAVAAVRSGTITPTTVYSAEPTVVVKSATPAATDVRSEGGPKDEVMLGTDGKPLAKAPAMTLGARNSGSGSAIKRERGRDDGKKKKKKKKKRQQLMINFDPDEMYDPNRPNDLGEYEQYRKRLREEKRAILLEEKRRKAEGRGSSGESSYYTDSEEDVPRRDAPKMFAPRYSPPPGARPPPPPPSMAARPRPPSPEASVDPYAAREAATPAPATGDDAYARRAAMAQAGSGDEAFARRAAMSQPATGDGAYARRAALSVQAAPAPPPSASPIPPPVMPPFPPPRSREVEQHPANEPAVSASSGSTSVIPGFGVHTKHTPDPSLASSSAPPAPAPASTASSTTAAGPDADFARLLEEKRKAAEAIAAKLRALAPGAPVVSAQSIPEPEGGDNSFAEKMMRKWGHVEGTGLGAQGTGIVHALTAQHVAKPVDPKAPLSKRQLAKQKAAAANAKNNNRKWIQNATNRGKIVDMNEEVRRQEEKNKYGEASRVICLIGMVGDVDEVDEDMSDEIGEECSKFGIVERVVLHMVEPAPADPAECLRVFIVYSGMAGAWRALKELDGRAFGGRRIKATYFDETKFSAGERDGPVLA